MKHHVPGRSRPFLSVGLVLVLALFAAACGGDDDDDATASADTTAPADDGGDDAGSGDVTFEGEIPFGFITDRVGNLSQYGESSYYGVHLAVDNINETGGIVVDGKHYELTLEECESRSEEAGAQSCAVELVEDKGVKVVFGGISKLSPIVMRVTDPASAIYFSSSSAAASFLGETNYMLATLGDFSWKADSTFKAITEFYPDAKNLVMFGEDDATMAALKPLLEERAPDEGYELSFELVPTGTTDLSGALTNVKNADPDVMIFVGTSPEFTQSVVRGVEELDAAPAIYAYSGSCPAAVDAGVSRPYVGNTLVGADLDYPSTERAKEFAAEFEAVAGADVLKFPVLWNYDFVWVAAKAIEAAGTADDSDVILDAMYDVSYDGVIGTVQFDRDSKTAAYGFEMCYTEGGTIDPADSKYIAQD